MKKIKHYFIAGLLSILPISITYLIIIKLFNIFSNPGANIVEYIYNYDVPKYFPELAGFMLIILFIYIIGIFMSNVVGKRIYIWFENILGRLPIINIVYGTIKQITSGLSIKNRSAFRKVVFIEYPRNGIWTLSLVTGESKNQHGTEYYHIFLPTTPNPTSGYFLYIPKKDTIDSEMSIDEGIKIIVSGGMLAPNTNNLDKNVPKK